MPIRLPYQLDRPSLPMRSEDFFRNDQLHSVGQSNRLEILSKELSSQNQFLSPAFLKSTNHGETEAPGWYCFSVLMEVRFS